MRRSLLALVLVLTACGGSKANAIRFQVFGDGAEVDAYRTLIAAFQKQGTGGSVELIPVPKQDEHMTKLATSFSGGNPPDAFLINYRRFGQLAARGVLEPLGERMSEMKLSAAEYYQQPMDAFRFKGTQTCVPQNASSLVVYYNTATFERFGVPKPKADWTWEEFLSTAKALTKDTDGDGKTDVYGVGTDPSLIRLAPFVWQAGGEVVDDTENPTRTVMLDVAAVKAATFFIELRRVHKVSPAKEEAESEEYEDRFTSGRLAMLLDSRRLTTQLRDVPGLQWDVAPLPRDVARATILHGDAYCVSRTSKAMDATLRFVSFALGPEGQTILSRTGRIVPALKSVAESPAFLDPALPPASARVWLDQIQFIRRVPNIATWNEIEQKGNIRVEEWYYGAEPPEQLGIEIDLDTRDLFVEAKGP